MGERYFQEAEIDQDKLDLTEIINVLDEIAKCTGYDNKKVKAYDKPPKHKIPKKDESTKHGKHVKHDKGDGKHVKRDKQHKDKKKLIRSYHLPVYIGQVNSGRQAQLTVDIPGPSNLTKHDKTIIKSYPQNLDKWISRHNKHLEYYKRCEKYVYIVTTILDEPILRYKIGLITAGLTGLRRQYSRICPGWIAYLLLPGNKPLEKAILNHPTILSHRERNPPTESGRLGKRSEWVVGLTLGQIIDVFNVTLGQKLVVPDHPLNR